MDHQPPPPAATGGSPSTRTGYWLSEHLPDGTDRHWSILARQRTARESDRAQVSAAIEAVTWYRGGAKVAFSPGALLNEIISKVTTPPIAFGISDLALELPEAGLSEHDRARYDSNPALLDPDLFETTSVVALAFREGRTVFCMYYLDEGVHARPVALDMRDLDPGPERSVGCAARLHSICQGRYITEGRDTRPCACDCGCRNRHQQATA
ncbi:hypothetical protein [Glycomyces sp. MUSA5-2]|uniref:hypothetical protein n=1 Tax=Glycomyces sp. MUSA5-2 TaxID=2053002 RepID=UPI00300A5DE2